MEGARAVISAPGHLALRAATVIPLLASVLVFRMAAAIESGSGGIGVDDFDMVVGREDNLADGNYYNQRYIQTAANVPDIGTSMPHTMIDVQGNDDWGMVQRSGNQFVLGGQPFYFNGFNTYWLMLLAVDQSTRGKVTDVFRQASAVGLTVCRTWGFNDGGWRALQKSPSVYDEDVFKALDFVVSEAKKFKIRLILSLANNWDGFGGKTQYVKWGKAAGLNLTSNDDFFSDPTVRGYYKAHIKTVLNRVNTFTNVTYKDDPTIFAWELMNEPQCRSDPSGDKIQAWIQEMAAHVKNIDPVHLLEIGLEGFYGPSTPERVRVNPNAFAGQVGTDFIRNHRTLGVDFASVHIYPDTWISSNLSNSHIQFAKIWMQTHIDDAETKLGGMPVIFSEFGINSNDANYTASFRDAFIGTVYATVLNSTRRGGSGGGCLLWQVFPEGTDYMDDGYAVVLSRSPTTASLVAVQSRRMLTFNSKCSWSCRWSCRKRDAAAGMWMAEQQLDEL